MSGTRRSLSALYALLADNTAGDISAQDVRDLAASTFLLDSIETSITGTATATLDAMHVCSGTSVDYTVTLPTAVGNAGRLMLFRMSNALTRLVTLDGNSSETIDDAAARVMWAGESALLISDGSQWCKIAGRSIPMTARMTRSSAQSIANNTVTKVTLNSATINTGTIADPTTNNRVNIRRAGNYRSLASWGASLIFDSGERIVTELWLNGVTTGTRIAINLVLSPSAAQSLVCVASTADTLAAGDFIEMAVQQNSGASLNTSTAGGFLPFALVEEVVSW